MIVGFRGMLAVGSEYSRPELARLWKYKGYQALCRGVVTPLGTPFIILFVTKEKQLDLEQYVDDLSGDELFWEGPKDHYAEERMVSSAEHGDEIHLFYRERHHKEFTYCGLIELIHADKRLEKPSKFRFRLTEYSL